MDEAAHNSEYNNYNFSDFISLTESKPIEEIPPKKKKQRHAITFGDEIPGGTIKEIHYIESYKNDKSISYNHAEFPK